MNQADRYENIARSLRYMGWLQDLMLRRARMKAVEHLQSHGVNTVLDVCCGAGTLSSYLHSAGMNVTGADLSDSMLQIARSKAPDVKFQHKDVTRLDLEEPVESSVIALSLHEMPEQTRLAVWSAMQRCTRRNGPLILIDYTPATQPSILSRAAQWVIWQDEKSLDKDDPGHFGNFRDFMSMGGARGWLLQHQQRIVIQDDFLFGNLGLFVVNNE